MSFFKDFEANRAYYEGEMETYDQVSHASMRFNYYHPESSRRKNYLPFSGHYVPHDPSLLPSCFETMQDYFKATDDKYDWKTQGSVMVGSVHIVEGFRHYLQSMRENGEFLNPWYDSYAIRYNSVWEKVDVLNMPKKVRDCVDVKDQMDCHRNDTARRKP